MFVDHGLWTQDYIPRTKGYALWIIYYRFRTIHIKQLTEEGVLWTDKLRLQS